MPLLSRSTPESQSIASEAVLSFLGAVSEKQLELHSVMLLRHGHVVAEGWWHPYKQADIHLLYSLSKSFTATAVGIAVDEKLLSVNDRVVSFFPEETPTYVSEHLAQMTVEHLLTMTTGHLQDTLEPTAEHESWLAGFLNLPPDVAPGTVFTYNNGATFMLAAILQKLTGITLLEYLRPRLLEPLGINDARWDKNPQGIQLGFSGLHLTTESVARFGQLYLNEGKWQGDQLIPQAWVKAAKAKHIQTTPPPEDGVTDWAQGYGYQFWLCRHDAYRGDGAFGQFCVVMPKQSAVLAVISGENDMQAVLDAAWEHLLPAFGEALPDDDSAHSALSNSLDALAYPPVEGKADSSLASDVLEQTFHFEPVEVEDYAYTKFRTLDIRRSAGTWTLVLEGERVHELTFGYGAWVAGSTTFYTLEKARTVASGAWIDAHTLKLQVRYIETPHCLTLHLTFAEDKLKLTMRWNVRFGELEPPPMIGVGQARD